MELSNLMRKDIQTPYLLPGRRGNGVRRASVSSPISAWSQQAPSDVVTRHIDSNGPGRVSTLFPTDRNGKREMLSLPPLPQIVLAYSEREMDLYKIQRALSFPFGRSQKMGQVWELSISCPQKHTCFKIRFLKNQPSWKTVVCAYVWACLDACARVCASWQHNCAFSTCRETGSYRKEEGKVLMFFSIIFFTLWKGKSGLVTLFFKGLLCHLRGLTVLWFSLMARHRRYSRESLLRRSHLDNSGVCKMLLLLIPSWVGLLHLFDNNRSPLP